MGWIFSSGLCYPLNESPSLCELGIRGAPIVPLKLPTLKVLRWMISAYYGLRFITAPHLHTLVSRSTDGGGPDLMVLYEFQTSILEHLSIQSIYSSPTALFRLFNGPARMRTPKSIHLDCAFTDAVLIAALGRLDVLEELQVAGTIAQDAFWEEFTPSHNLSWQEWLLRSPLDQRTNLKILLVNYSMGNMTTLLKLQSTT